MAKETRGVSLDYLSDYYDVLAPAERSRIRQKQIELIGLEEGERVLEVGCGTGSTALLHAPYVRELLATDFAEGMIGIARERAAEAGLDNVRFEVASLESLAGRDERFDVVLALNVLHLVVDLDAALASMVSLL